MTTNLEVNYNPCFASQFSSSQQIMSSEQPEIISSYCDIDKAAEQEGILLSAYAKFARAVQYVGEVTTPTYETASVIDNVQVASSDDVNGALALIFEIDLSDKAAPTIKNNAKITQDIVDNIQGIFSQKLTNYAAENSQDIASLKRVVVKKLLTDSIEKYLSCHVPDTTEGILLSAYAKFARAVQYVGEVTTPTYETASVIDNVQVASSDDVNGALALIFEIDLSDKAAPTIKNNAGITQDIVDKIQGIFSQKLTSQAAETSQDIASLKRVVVKKLLTDSIADYLIVSADKDTVCSQAVVRTTPETITAEQGFGTGGITIHSAQLAKVAKIGIPGTLNSEGKATISKYIYDDGNIALALAHLYVAEDASVGEHKITLLDKDNNEIGSFVVNVEAKEEDQPNYGIPYVDLRLTSELTFKDVGDDDPAVKRDVDWKLTEEASLYWKTPLHSTILAKQQRDLYNDYRLRLDNPLVGERLKVNDSIGARVSATETLAESPASFNNFTAEVFFPFQFKIWNPRVEAKYFMGHTISGQEALIEPSNSHTIEGYLQPARLAFEFDKPGIGLVIDPMSARYSYLINNPDVENQNIEIFDHTNLILQHSILGSVDNGPIDARLSFSYLGNYIKPKTIEGEKKSEVTDEGQPPLVVDIKNEEGDLPGTEPTQPIEVDSSSKTMIDPFKLKLRHHILETRFKFNYQVSAGFNVGAFGLGSWARFGKESNWAHHYLAGINFDLEDFGEYFALYGNREDFIDLNPDRTAILRHLHYIKFGGEKTWRQSWGDVSLGGYLKWERPNEGPSRDDLTVMFDLLFTLGGDKKKIDRTKNFTNPVGWIAPWNQEGRVEPRVEEESAPPPPQEEVAPVPAAEVEFDSTKAAKAMCNKSYPTLIYDTCVEYCQDKAGKEKVEACITGYTAAYENGCDDMVEGDQHFCATACSEVAAADLPDCVEAQGDESY